MTPNNNLSILPFYKVTTANPTPRDDQNWWAYGDVFPLVTPGIPPFIIEERLLEGEIWPPVFELKPVYPNTEGGIQNFTIPNIYEKTIGGKTYVICPGYPMDDITGRYVLERRMGAELYTSDVFTIVHALKPYLKIEWWDDKDFVMDAGVIPYVTSPTTTPLVFDTNVRTSRYINADGSISTSTSWNLFYFSCTKGDKFSFTYTGSLPTTSARLYAVYSTDDPNNLTAQTALEVGEVLSLGTTEIEIRDDNAKMIAVTVSSGTSLITTGNKTVQPLPYRNVLYLPSDIAKPEYIFEEEVENRDGYTFPIKQISEKRYKFSFLAPEYLLDVMRLIRMSDHIKITYRGQEYYPDSFLMTPTWEGNGNLANVVCEFDTDTVAKKIGRMYDIPQGGDFNDDYNNDFNN